MTEQERFWAKVRVCGPDECWLWLAATKGVAGKEYGNFTVKREGRWVQKGAHILSWEYENGPVPEGMCVCHSCDVMLCVNNQRHLFIGTVLENNRDMVAKRRHQFGERHWRAKLADATLATIERLAAAGKSQQAIGDELGIGQSAVSRILSGKRRLLRQPDVDPYLRRALVKKRGAA